MHTYIYSVILFFYWHVIVKFLCVVGQSSRFGLFVRCRTRILEQDDPKERERHLMKFIKIMKVIRLHTIMSSRSISMVSIMRSINCWLVIFCTFKVFTLLSLLKVVGSVSIKFRAILISKVLPLCDIKKVVVAESSL